MAVSFKYWDDCVDPEDMEAMWREWIKAGETRGSKVHLSRDPDGQPYLTQVEMKAVARIVISRHFVSHIDWDMVCAIAELESDRRPLATRELGYQTYEVLGDSKLLYKPFVNVYLGAAYLKWLSNYDHKERSEEFMVRSYKAGTKKAARRSTLAYWKLYLSVKESLPSRKLFEVGPLPNGPSVSATPAQLKKGLVKTTWDSRASPEDMEEMWNHSIVSKEWIKSGEKRGKVRISHDIEKRPYLSRAELRAVADIVLSKHFNRKGIKSVKPIVLCALAEIVSFRFLNGVGQRTGLMGID